jgi:hypothetical protein
MRKGFILLTVSLMLGAMAGATIAQNECSFDLTGANEALAVAQASIDASDSEAALSAVSDARAALELQEANCVDYAPEEAGNSRTNPVPFGQRQQAEYSNDFMGSIEMMEYLDDGEDLIMALNRSNDPAPRSKRYVILSFKLFCERDPAESCEYSRVDFSLVGDKGVSYRYDSASIHGLENDAEFFGGAEIIEVVAFLVNSDDDNFVMFTEYGDPRVFFATQ